MQQRILINGQKHQLDWLETTDQGQSILACAYSEKGRARCQCRPEGVEMYVAKKNRYFLARMPGTGSSHLPGCRSYSLPAKFSGLSDYSDSAIRSRADGIACIAINFNLSRFDKDRTTLNGDAHSGRPRREKRDSLSLLGLLHYLWDEAELNRWVPKMAGKRNWAVVRHHLNQAAEKVETKGLQLASRLFMPEQFDKAKAAAINERHVAAIKAIVPGGEDRVVKFMLVLGAVKSIEKSEFGRKITLFHLPNHPIWLREKAAVQMEARFKFELLSAGDEKRAGNLVAFMLVEASCKPNLSANGIVLMSTTPNWIPLRNPQERLLADKLTANDRSFHKPLQFDSSAEASFPSFLLTDAGDEVAPLEVVTPDDGVDKIAETLKRIANNSKKSIAKWIWDVRSAPSMPDLPAQARK